MKDENTDSDYEVIQRCRKGDVEAFEDIVRKYQKKMFNISYRMTGDYNEAAEVVQDAFLSVYRNIKSFKGKSKFSTWLFTIVMNLSRNKIKQLQSRRHRENFSIDDPVETDNGKITVEPLSDNPSAQERLEQHQRDQKIRGCIRSLENEFREVIVLRDIQGFSYDEISDMLKIAMGTVRSRLHRARLSVRDCLKKLIGDL
jgi:RNA polymerase sigma-70 factor (ECF subfamily)